MKALETGGAGIAWSHLADALAPRDDKVTIIDPLPASRPEDLRRSIGRWAGALGRSFARVLRSRIRYETLGVTCVGARIGVANVKDRVLACVATSVQGTDAVSGRPNERGLGSVTTCVCRVDGNSTSGRQRDYDRQAVGSTTVTCSPPADAQARDEDRELALVGTGLPLTVRCWLNTDWRAADTVLSTKSKQYLSTDMLGLIGLGLPRPRSAILQVRAAYHVGPRSTQRRGHAYGRTPARETLGFEPAIDPRKGLGRTLDWSRSPGVPW